jgi:hypothetical protein
VERPDPDRRNGCPDTRRNWTSMNDVKFGHAGKIHSANAGHQSEWLQVVNESSVADLIDGAAQPHMDSDWHERNKI